MHISREKSHQVGYTFEICLSSCQMESHLPGTVGASKSQAKKEGGQGTSSTRTQGAPNSCTPPGQARGCRQPVLVVEDTGAAGDTGGRRYRRRSHPPGTNLKGVGYSLAVLEKLQCIFTKPQYRTLLNTLAWQKICLVPSEFPQGQRRSGYMSPSQSRPGQYEVGPSGEGAVCPGQAFSSPTSLSSFPP